MDQSIDQIEGYVLAGGASSRMGRDKARMCVGGKPLFERAASALSDICYQVFLVGGDGIPFVSGPGLDIVFIPDIQTDGENTPRAPIIGLYTALMNAKTDWIAALACDLPCVTGSLFRRLRSFRSNDFDAVVPVQKDARSQPLCAFYKRERCLEAVESMLTEGDLKLQRLLSRVQACYVGFDEISALPGPGNFFLNVNTYKDYELAKSTLES
jgi:molybdopterin-guanine dinucleotide biosynthesis protein A